MAKPTGLVQRPTCPRDAGDRPRVFVGAAGALVRDADGTDWVDLDNARGSVLLGHADPEVAEAVAAAAAGRHGVATGWSPTLDRVVDVIEALAGSPVAALFRTGTAAVRAAALAVREIRGRPLLVSSGYHGFDPMWRPPTSGFAPNSDGVIDVYYDLERLSAVLADPGRIAAFVVAPDHVHLGPDWHRSAADLCRSAGVPVVLDEVKTGLRYRPGLSLDPADMAADVWVLSKGMANGLPIAAVGGDRKLLEPLRPASYTSFFEPCVLAAAEVTLQRLATGEVQRAVSRAGQAFVAHCRARLRAAGVPVEVVGGGPLFQFVCADREVETGFYTATAAAGLLCYEQDNQAPSAALDSSALDTARERFDQVCWSLAGRWPNRAVRPMSRYAAAWQLLDGLADLPRRTGEGMELVERLRAGD